MGETKNQPLQLSFNKFLRVDFQGSRVTSDGGLILVRELDERLGMGGPEHTKEVIGTTKPSRDSPHRGHGDVSLPQEDDWRMFVRKGKVETGNSGTDPWRYDGRGRLNLTRVPVRPPVAGGNGVR